MHLLYRTLQQVGFLVYNKKKDIPMEEPPVWADPPPSSQLDFLDSIWFTVT